MRRKAPDVARSVSASRRLQPVIVALIVASLLQHLWQLRRDASSDGPQLQLEDEEVFYLEAAEDPGIEAGDITRQLAPRAAHSNGDGAASGRAQGGRAESLWQKTAEVLRSMDPSMELDDVVEGDGDGDGNGGREGSSSRERGRGRRRRESRRPGQDPLFMAPMTGVPGGIGQPTFDNWTLYMLDDSPLLLHQDMFHKPGCRLGGDINENGQPHSAVLRFAVDSAGRMHSWSPEAAIDPRKTDTKLMYPSRGLPALPYNDTRWAFASCAIVSNSGTLLQAKFGSDIDEHDAVFRLNNAPTVGFEKYVGSKTTFNLLNRPHADEVSRQAGLDAHEGAPPQAAVLFEADNWHLYYHLLERMLKHMPYPKTLVLAPSFLDKVNQLWMRLAKRWPRYANSCSQIKRAAHEGDASARCQKMIRDCQNDVCKPSSGFFALVMASQMCNKIDMYGFESWRKSYPSTVTTKRKRSHYHYFDDEEGVTSVHSFILIMKVFEFLSHRFPIVIKTPDYDPEEERHMEAIEKLSKNAEPLIYSKQGVYSARERAKAGVLRGREWVREHFKDKDKSYLGAMSSMLKRADDQEHTHLRSLRAEDEMDV
eukprot:jgi/Tetstr1/444269/TSEL_032161.t1